MSQTLNIDNAGNELGKLFIGGLSQETTNEGLTSYFSKFGAIEDSIVMMDNRTNRSRGFGYVKYRDRNIVDKVLNSQPHIIDGKQVDVKQCNINMKGRNRRNLKIFVGGIAPDQNSESVREFFSLYGTVTDVNLMMDPTKQRHRGFAYVGFDDENVVKNLISQHYLNFSGKQIEIKPMEPPNFNKRNGVMNGPPNGGGNPAMGGGGGGGMQIQPGVGMQQMFPGRGATMGARGMNPANPNDWAQQNAWAAQQAGQTWSPNTWTAQNAAAAGWPAPQAWPNQGVQGAWDQTTSWPSGAGAAGGTTGQWGTGQTAGQVNAASWEASMAAASAAWGQQNSAPGWNTAAGIMGAAGANGVTQQGVGGWDAQVQQGAGGWGDASGRSNSAAATGAWGAAQSGQQQAVFNPYGQQQAAVGDRNNWRGGVVPDAGQGQHNNYHPYKR